MNEKLYFIANVGCDDTTYGLVRLTDEDFEKFKIFIQNLNRNSRYSCMPVIYVYIVEMSHLKEVDCDDTDIDKSDVYYLDDKMYTFAERYFPYYDKLERVIGGRE